MPSVLKGIATAAALVLPSPAGACGIELVLALDVSRSVINAEYDQQVIGLATALRDSEIVQAIGHIHGGVAVTVMQWSGPDSQIQTIPWRLLSTPQQVARFADAVESDRRRFFAAYTAIGDALLHARDLSRQNPWTCARRIIDLSGDGISNRGSPPRAIADALAAEGVTINAVVIDGASPDPVSYYANNVIAGSGSFMVIARDFDDYTRAIREKLGRELAPAYARK